MGACASFPKILGKAATKAPAPEQPVEEKTDEAVVVADKAMEEQEEVKSTVEGEEKSLGSLVETYEQVKKEAAEVAPPVVAEVNEKKTEATPTEEAKKE